MNRKAERFGQELKHTGAIRDYYSSFWMGTARPPLIPQPKQEASLRRKIVSKYMQPCLVEKDHGCSPGSLPIPYSDYFDERIDVVCPDRGTTFNVYTAGSTGPVLFCIHGGGYTGLTWALIASRMKSTCRIVAPDLRGHGLTRGDHEADLSLATLTADVSSIWKQLFFQQQERKEAGGEEVVAPAPPPTILIGHSMGGAVAAHVKLPHDIRGLIIMDVVEGTAMASLPHMSSVLARRPPAFATLEDSIAWALASGTSKNPEAARISIPAMLTEIDAAVKEGVPDLQRLPTPAVPITLAGEKLKAALASSQEGSLMSITEEEDYSSQREECLGLGRLPTPAVPVEYRGEVKTNPRDARFESAMAPFSEEEEDEEEKSDLKREGNHHFISSMDKEEEDEENEGSPAPPAFIPPSPYEQLACSASAAQSTSAKRKVYSWRTQLGQSQIYWEGWYKGLSDLFLKHSAPKVLVLAGTDRLDKTLTVGQMQGRFQLVLMPQSGHAIQEDEPEKTSETILDFLQRFKLVEKSDKGSQLPLVLPTVAGPKNVAT